MPDRPKRPRDINQLGVTIAKLATGEIADEPAKDERDAAAVNLGSRGGRARAAKLTDAERSAIARKAATERWAKRLNDPECRS